MSGKLSTVPLGQRTSTFSTSVSEPNPKCTHLLDCERKASPARSVWIKTGGSGVGDDPARWASVHRNTGANRIAIALGALQSKGNVSVFGVIRCSVDRGVSHQTKSRPGAIAQPHVQVAVLIPIGYSQRAAVIDKIQSRDRRRVGEPRPAAIQVDAVGLETAERVALSQHAIGGLQGISIRKQRFAGGVLWMGRGRCLRHDLSPNEASQVVRNDIAHEAVGDDQIGPAVVCQIDKFGGPGPTAHLDGFVLADVGELCPARPGIR